MQTISHWIDGKAVQSQSGQFGPVHDPATGEKVARVGFADVEETDRVVASSLAAYADWRNTSLTRRMQIMFAVRSLLDEARDELAGIISSEHGKTLDDARGEVQRGLESVEFACGIAHHLKGSQSQEVSSGVDIMSVREPVGIVGCITPFNFPVMVPLWMIPNALACGNAVILKPSEKDPSASLYLAELFARAGLPEGVLNVLQGDRAAVTRLIEHPDVAALSFVGSTPVARSIYKEGSSHGKRVLTNHETTTTVYHEQD